MSNSTRRKVKISTLMRAKSFRIGYDEIRDGIAMDADKFANSASDQWKYERGRMCGVIAKAAVGCVPPLKIGRDFNPSAIEILNPELGAVFF